MVTISEARKRLDVILHWSRGKFWFRTLDHNPETTGATPGVGLNKLCKGKDDKCDLMYELDQYFGSEDDDVFIKMYEYIERFLKAYEESYNKAVLKKMGKNV